MNIKELLQLRGLDTTAKIKLVRHQDKRRNLDKLYRDGFLDLYQSYQTNNVFDGCKYIVSFLGWEGTQARFVGVYRVMGRKSQVQGPHPSNLPYPELAQGKVYYELEPVPGFEDLKDRVIIDWGKSALAWHQYLSEKEVVEILPRGYVKDFPGYLEILITYDELVEIINNPGANREWHRMLSAVAGIYLIVDSATGRQYVGSAYGKDGFLGRWTTYANNPDGGNKKLQELLAGNEAYARNFRYSILHTLPKTLTDQEVIAYERIFMNKLGSRAFGLNL